MKTNIPFIFGQFLREVFERWLPKTSPILPTLVYDDGYTGWPTETNDNWHENSDDYIWHASPTNEWEAASLPPGWGDFTPSTTLTK
jgi:hypothetical protein